MGVHIEQAGHKKFSSAINDLHVFARLGLRRGGNTFNQSFFDMHAHFFFEQGEHINTNETELKLMLANGVTTARIMAGHPSYLEARANVKNGQWRGPELNVASPQLVGRWPFAAEFKNYEVVASDAKANEAVTTFKQQGYDAIKITFMMAKPIYHAVVEAAAREKIKVVGHVGPMVMLPAAPRQ